MCGAMSDYYMSLYNYWVVTFGNLMGLKKRKFAFSTSSLFNMFKSLYFFCQRLNEQDLSKLVEEVRFLQNGN